MRDAAVSPFEHQCQCVYQIAQRQKTLMALLDVAIVADSDILFCSMFGLCVWLS